MGWNRLYLNDSRVLSSRMNDDLDESGSMEAQTTSCGHQEYHTGELFLNFRIEVGITLKT